MGEGGPSQRLRELLSRYLLYRERYGTLEGLDQVERLQQAISRRRVRAAHLQRQLSDTQRELEEVSAELADYETGLESLLDGLVERIREQHAEAWSPTPIPGFRLWAIRPDGLYGARVRWPTSHLTARCLTRGGEDDLPHSDGRCGRLGCGIYATKDLAALLADQVTPYSDGYAAGLVALSGKVVEHERGYRAERARTLAVVATGAGKFLSTDDADEVDRLFVAPLALLELRGRERPRALLAHMHDYLTGIERSLTWTSESSSG